MALVSAKATQCLGCCDVPEEDGAVTAHGRECCVGRGDGDVEDGVAVRGVGLDELAWAGRSEGVGIGGGGGTRGVVETDGAVGGAG